MALRKHEMKEKHRTWLRAKRSTPSARSAVGGDEGKEEDQMGPTRAGVRA